MNTLPMSVQTALSRDLAALVTTILTVILVPSSAQAVNTPRPVRELCKSLLSHVNPAVKPDYESGELVEIHPRPDAQYAPISLAAVHHGWDTNHTAYTISRESLPTLGIVQHSISNSEYAVKMRFPFNGRYRNTLLVVPTEIIQSTPFGTNAKLLKALSAFNDVDFQFERGQRVRYRDWNSHSMIEAEILEIQDEWVQISTRGHIIEKHRDEIFPLPGPRAPFTPHYSADWLETNGTKELAEVAVFNAAAKLTSHPEWIASENIEKLHIISRLFSSRLLQSRQSVLQSHQAGLRQFSQFLQAGLGVCRHRSVLIARALEEAGYSSRLTWVTTNTKEGHAWVEVDMPSSDGGFATYVVDGQYHVVTQLGKVLQEAAQNPESAWGLIYGNPDRQFLLPTNENSPEESFWSFHRRL